MVIIRLRYVAPLTSPLITLALVVAQPLSSNEHHTVSVCELFRDLRSHAGDIVSVRGLLYQGSEVFALGAHCDTKFVTPYNWAPMVPGIQLPPTGEYEWPTALDLKGSEFSERGEVPVSFQTQREEVNQTYRLIESELARNKLDAKDAEVHVTVIGQLRVKRHYNIARLSDGRLAGEGYGHMGAYPAQLVIKTMLDPVVKRKSKR